MCGVCVRRQCPCRACSHSVVPRECQCVCVAVSGVCVCVLLLLLLLASSSSSLSVFHWLLACSTSLSGQRVRYNRLLARQITLWSDAKSVPPAQFTIRALMGPVAQASHNRRREISERTLTFSIAHFRNRQRPRRIARHTRYTH